MVCLVLALGSQAFDRSGSACSRPVAFGVDVDWMHSMSQRGLSNDFRAFRERSLAEVPQKQI